ncbi:MAG: glycerophosphoryl diester phosphodiesterase [Candidatus Hydrogenedentota bacterium]
MIRTVLVCCIPGLLAGIAASADPIIIAHRGASGHLPEHTLAAYAVAHAQGADYIEPDLVLTKDGTFICLHDIHLEATTNVEEVFPDRKRDDGRWYAADFTLAEIKTLRVHERLANRFPQDALYFEVPTFEEMLKTVEALNTSAGRNAGVYPELKEPSWHAEQGLPMEAAFLEIIRAHNLDRLDAPIFVQCFEPDALKRLRGEMGCKAQMIQLISGGVIQDGMVTQDGLKAIAAYAQGIGPDKGRIVKNPEVVKWAHAANLKVHPYTLRADQVPQTMGSFEDELRQFFATFGVDGIFTDHPGQAKIWVASHKEK